MAQEVLDEHGARRRPDQQRRPLDPPLDRALLRPLPRLRADDAAQLLRPGADDPAPAADDAQAAHRTDHQRLARSACRRTCRASPPTSPRSRRSTRSRAASPREIIDDGINITTIHMPLVRTPMIAPTKMYDRFPTITPDEAAEMLTDAIIFKPKRIATPMGTLGQVLYAINPKSIDYILNSAYHLFPDSTAAKKGKVKTEGGDRRGDRRPGYRHRRAGEPPAARLRVPDARRALVNGGLGAPLPASSSACGRRPRRLLRPWQRHSQPRRWHGARISLGLVALRPHRCAGGARRRAPRQRTALGPDRGRSVVARPARHLRRGRSARGRGARADLAWNARLRGRGRVAPRDQGRLVVGRR